VGNQTCVKIITNPDNAKEIDDQKIIRLDTFGTDDWDNFDDEDENLEAEMVLRLAKQMNM